MGRSRQLEIDELQSRILACRACQEAGHIPEAAPVCQTWSPRQRVMVVGQAPGLQTHFKRFHFAGPGGLLLGKWLAQAGFPEGDWREYCYVSSLTRCFPGKAPAGSGDRRPSPAEIALCAPFLVSELELVRPGVILAVGGMAIERFLGKRRLEDVVGEVFEHGTTQLLPLPHPSGVSRWLNTPANRALVDRALGRLSGLRVELGL